MARQAARGFDAVVVGAGSAGCAAAARLVAAGQDVCLLEAGPDYGSYEEGSWPADLLDASVDAIETHDWGFPGGAASSRARVVGGCSAHNGCGVVWPAPEDIDGWALPGWSFAVLEPYLHGAERALRSRPSRAAELEPWRRAFLDAAVERGYARVEHLNDPEVTEGVGLLPVNAVGTVRWNAAFAYLDPIRGHGRLTLLDRVLVDRIATPELLPTVLAHDERGKVAFAADRVVLAAGAYATPAILQRSGIGDPAGLARLGIGPLVELPGVGRNLQDHPTVDVPFRPTAALQHAYPPAAAAGPAAQCLLKARSSHAPGKAWDLVLGPWTARRPGGGIAYGGILATVSLPRSRGRIHVRSAEPAILPAVEHGFLADIEGHDCAVALEGVALARELASSQAARPWLRSDGGEDLDADWLRGAIGGNYHPCATCAMGKAGDGSVVDERGRVHGTERLYVVDASVLPAIPRANIHLTVIAVAERLVAGML